MYLSVLTLLFLLISQTIIMKIQLTTLKVINLNWSQIQLNIGGPKYVNKWCTVNMGFNRNKLYQCLKHCKSFTI